MKDNSNSALRIREAIVILPVLLIFGTVIQLFSMNTKTTQVAETEIQEEIQVATTEFEREGITTTRSDIERTSNTQEIEEVPTIQYKTIEEIEISKDMDLTVRCGISKEDFNTLMANLSVDTSGFFETNSSIIYDLCEKYELNEIFFCGLIAGESGWNIASNHRNTHNYISMMSNGKLIRYSSDEEGLEAAAKLLHNRYLTEGGSYYRGKTLSSVQKIFCPNSSTWVGLIYGCMKQVIK